MDPLFLERWALSSMNAQPRAFDAGAAWMQFALQAPLQEREVVSNRVPIGQFAFEGRFDGP
jgi:hypothetical protein